MKLIIAGGRNYHLTPSDLARLDELAPLVTEVVSGGATGADREGELWAERQGIPTKRFPADWHQYGHRAGPIRNEAMSKYADAVVLFPGGNGTASMARLAKEAGIRVYDFRQPREATPLFDDAPPAPHGGGEG